MSRRKDLTAVAQAVSEVAAGPAIPKNTGHEDPRAKLPLRARLVLAIGASAAYDELAVRCRRSYPIAAFVGPNGGGKTLALMVTSAPTRKGIRWACDNPAHQHTREGVTEGWRRMLSTVPILDGAGGLHPLYDKFDSFEQLVTVEHSDVYMDEVTSVASSRDSARMDARVLNKLVQLRKSDVMLFWTAPNWARADKVMREVTQIVVECRGYFPEKPAPGAELTTIWRPKRVFRFRTYDASEFEEWTASKRENVTPLNSQWFKGPGSEAFTAYDTLGSVTLVASITPEDTCTVCEGRVVRHTCQCHKKRVSLTPPEPLDVALMPRRRRPVTLTPPGAPHVHESVDA